MPKRRLLGHKTTATINTVLQVFVKSFKPHDTTRELVDVTVFADDAVTNLDSDPPDYGEITVTLFWDPEDTDDIAVDTFFENDDIAEREATILLKIPNTRSGTAPTASTITYTTITYVGRITNIGRNEIVSKSEIMRTITMKVNQKPVKS